jgi:medium-chain acyl-[acyl-carrier-protein] hydrolase
MKHINKLSIKSYFINRFGELSISFMFYQMQEIAWEHANMLGFGYNQLKEARQFWVLSKLLVKIMRRPLWTENITLETWSRGTDGFYGYRDFHFKDSDGNNIIQATSSWLILDANTRRIVRLGNFKEFPEYSESIFGKNPSKIKSPSTDKITDFTPVLFNEIDINQHFNTGRYLERIIDSYSFDFHKKNTLAEFEVNFLKEGRPTDYLTVIKQQIDESSHLCSVTRECDRIDLIRARLEWGLR